MDLKDIVSKLQSLDVSKKTEKKNGLTYLSWSWAWDEVLKIYPNAQYEILKFENNLPYVYDENTGYMVFTTVTIEGKTCEMWLPVMDGANKAMKKNSYTYKGFKWENGVKKEIEKSVQPATMFDINKAIMRCLVKNLAMFGLGLYIYAGEDLPENAKKTASESQIKAMIEKGTTVSQAEEYFILTDDQKARLQA